MPIGVFVVLILTLRDPLACLNLVATMVLTYAFALGATHLVFVSILGGRGNRLEGALFPFRPPRGRGCRLQCVPDGPPPRGVACVGACRAGITRAVGQTGGLITSAAAITACSFASFLFSPLSSLRQLGFALVVGITIDAILVRPLLVPCGHWLINRSRLVARIGLQQPADHRDRAR